MLFTHAHLCTRSHQRYQVMDPNPPTRRFLSGRRLLLKASGIPSLASRWAHSPTICRRLPLHSTCAPCHPAKLHCGATTPTLTRGPGYPTREIPVEIPGIRNLNYLTNEQLNAFEKPIPIISPTFPRHTYTSSIYPDHHFPY